MLRLSTLENERALHHGGVPIRLIEGHQIDDAVLEAQASPGNSVQAFGEGERRRVQMNPPDAHKDREQEHGVHLHIIKRLALYRHSCNRLVTDSHRKLSRV